MLKFILGRASSGKTYTVLNKIKDAVSSGKTVVLVVPEQFSFESEKAMLNLLGDGHKNKVSVLPFTRIYETIGRLKGGICGKTITSADKIILMNRAIKSVADELKLWGKYSSSSIFAENMIRVIEEFKYNAISSTDLRNAINFEGNKKLADKLSDTATIMDSYQMVLGSNFVDPTDYMDKLYSMLEDCDYFSDKDVYFDGFKSFSGQQFKIIERIMSKASNVTFTFTDDINDKRELSLISNIRTIQNRITNIAKAHNIKIDQPLFLGETHYKNDGLKAFEKCMFEGVYNSEIDMPSVTVCKAESIFDETEFVSRNIRRIVRQKGAKYSDFVVIARDTAPYEDAFGVACKRNKIKCFIDKKIPLRTSPIAATVIAAISYAINPTSNNIFKFHKSGIGILSVDEISELENYAYIWNIKGKDFKNIFDMNPLGFTERKDEKSEEKLKRINEIRIKAIAPLVAFKENFSGTPKNRVSAIMKLIGNDSAKEVYLKLYDDYLNNKNEQYADAFLNSYSEIVSIFDSIVRCFPDADITNTAFLDAFKSSVDAATVGTTPQTLDEAIFGVSDRIRPARPKYAFVMGANQGIFPKTTAPTGLFTNLEFAKLKENGLDIPDRTETMAIDEDMLVYMNTCCASDEVYISYTTTLADGSSSEASPFLDEICANLKVNKVTEPDALSNNNLPETIDSALLEYSKKSGTDFADQKTLRRVIEASQSADELNVLDSDFSAQKVDLKYETAKKLYGNYIHISPTKFDEYNRCKFMFFCKNALKASKLYPADFNVMQRGTLIHYVLQRVIEVFGKGIADLNEDEIRENVHKYCDEYLGLIKGYKNIENSRTRYLVSNMERGLVYVVNRLSLEFAQSDFEPKECELKIGNGGKIPEIKIELDNDNILSLDGVIDRLDTYNGYIRIVDYKSGSRSFKLPDILVGQNMQMLLYLYTVYKSKIYGNQPAGILYMGAKRVKDGNPSDRRMNGLLVADGDVSYAMDKENKGEFIPKFNEDNPSDSYITTDGFEKLFLFVDKKLKTVGEDIFEGKISANPIDGIDSPACKYCDFRSVCRINEDNIKKVPKISNDEVLRIIEKGEDLFGS